MTLGDHWNLRIDRYDRIFVITMQKDPGNRLNVRFSQEIIRALRDIEHELGPNSEGCVVTKGSDEKYWCTGLELDEADTNPFANSDGFFPLLATLLDYPFPTIALLTGHTFGGACPFALAHDYRIMNSSRGFFSMPPVDLGLHFSGIGFLPRLKLRPQIARKMLLEAHRWTGKEAYEDGIVDDVAAPKDMLEVAMTKARHIQGKSKMGVYSLLRNELWGEAAEKIRGICYVHGRMVTAPAKAKI
ncbi:hypothetical protein IAQ61_000229 [Plenodomus lingam]|nr:hypothetical protein IAQ61_000229 [Plenodomus lingam]